MKKKKTLIAWDSPLTFALPDPPLAQTTICCPSLPDRPGGETVPMEMEEVADTT